jgi:hypothetical protein
MHADPVINGLVATLDLAIAASQLTRLHPRVYAWAPRPWLWSLGAGAILAWALATFTLSIFVLLRLARVA